MPRVSYLLFLGLVACSEGGSLAGSSFDANDEGWSVNGDAAGKIELRSVGGNPGGHVCGKDGVNADLWYFVAPSRFLGDKSNVYEQRLTWDLKQDQMFQQVSGRDVVIQGTGLTIIFNLKATPGREWTAYSARLDATANSGWRVDQPGGGDPTTFPFATEAEMRSVLKNVTSLRFRGEFTDGPDSACLDNVFFGIP